MAMVDKLIKVVGLRLVMMDRANIVFRAFDDGLETGGW